MESNKEIFLCKTDSSIAFARMQKRGSQLLSGVKCNVPTACSLSWYTTYAFEAVEGKDHQRARIPTLPLFFESIF
jgi:hypothetical protein